MSNVEPVAVAILAKAPLPGLAKTRLIPALGREGAALSHAVASVRAISRACNSAAPSRPSAGMSRVFARPGSGALARIATATGSMVDISVASGERRGIRAQEECHAQPP